MDVSVVIPTYNRWSSLKLCLDSLMNQTILAKQIIIVDGGSNDGTSQGVKSYPVDFLISPKKGLVNAYNYGIKKANYEIVAFIDDDAIAKNTWLEKILFDYNHFSNAGAIGGLIINKGNKQQFSIETFDDFKRNYFIDLYNRIFLENKQNQVGIILRNGAIHGNFSSKLSKPIKVDHLRGVNMSFKRDILKKINYFDPRYDVQHSTLFETDACFQVKKAGFEVIFDPQAIVWHYSQSEGSDIISLVHNDLLFYLKNIKKVNGGDDLKFILRYIFQLIFNLILNVNGSENVKKTFLNLYKIPPTIARAIINN